MFVLLVANSQNNEPGNSGTSDLFSSENIIKSITCDDIPEQVNLICDRYYQQYFANGCGCKAKCHEQFSQDIVSQARLDALQLDTYCASHVNHQHLLLLGAMNALVKTPNASIKSMITFS